MGSTPFLLQHLSKISTALRWNPHPVNFEVFKASVKHSGLQSRIQGLRCALGDRDSIGTLRINSSMGHHLIKEDSGEFDVIDTPVHRLDNLIKRCHFGHAAARFWLKIDTEGREGSVLSGAREILESGKVQGILWESSVGHLVNPANTEIELYLQGFGFATKQISQHSMFSILTDQINQK